MWSLGCLIVELVNRRPIFVGSNSTEQIFEIIKILGSPTKDDLNSMNTELTDFSFIHIDPTNLENIINSKDKLLIDLLRKIFVYISLYFLLIIFNK